MVLTTRRIPSVLAVGALLLALAGPAASSEPDPEGSGGHGHGPGTSGKVARLLEDAAQATQEYEHGRRAAEVQRQKAQRLERLVTRHRKEMKRLNAELGRIARGQYRDGGGIPYAAQLLLADDPEELMRGQRAALQANLAMNHLIDKTQRAARRLDEDQQRATAAWHSLDERRARLATLKSGLEKKLEDARWTLQGEADRQVAAGACRGAVRLDQPSLPKGRPWVAPVETYELSAGFGSGGERWAKRHTGQDFAVGIGEPVRSVGAGRVVRVSCGGAFGMEVLVRHPGGYYSQYAHLASVTVDQGEKVRAGQWVGQAGTTGNSTGPHLHFEIRLTPYLGSGVDPRRWLAERGVKL
ncbi:M23 family metallopeptidase [Streptomyces indicus]|uniref:Peptidase family M23 n=1 Tax=Streptomyces indicus TaxID=417292 RepID=A0A1G9EXA8_9ACTN|nr:M23 family metallopeptidase [Streptomyces indicus]SDK80723.1 Peptidase family M23 [Streptomyces indicus]